MTDSIEKKVNDCIIPDFDNKLKEAHEAGKELDYICHLNHIMTHGNRLQKIWVVCDPSSVLKFIWINQGVKGFLSMDNYKFLWCLFRYDYWLKAKSIWKREVLA